MEGTGFHCLPLSTLRPVGRTRKTQPRSPRGGHAPSQAGTQDSSVPGPTVPRPHGQPDLGLLLARSASPPSRSPSSAPRLSAPPLSPGLQLPPLAKHPFSPGTARLSPTPLQPGPRNPSARLPLDSPRLSPAHLGSRPLSSPLLLSARPPPTSPSARPCSSKLAPPLNSPPLSPAWLPSASAPTDPPRRLHLLRPRSRAFFPAEAQPCSRRPRAPPLCKRLSRQPPDPSSPFRCRRRDWRCASAGPAPPGNGLGVPTRLREPRACAASLF